MTDEEAQTSGATGNIASGPTDMFSTIRYLRKHISVEPTLFLYSLAVFMNAPTLQNLTFTKICLETGGEIDYCVHNITAREDEDVQKWTSHWMLYTTIAFLAPASIMSMYAGSWGDRLGRKIPLVIPPIGFIITVISYALFSLYIQSSPLWTIPFIAAVNGLCGGEITMIASSVSYITSVSNNENRIQRLAIVEGMITMGATLGPLASGFLATHYGHTVVFFTVSGFIFASLIYTIFFVHDIKINAERQSFKTLFSLRHIQEAVVICFKPRLRNDKRSFIILSLIASSLAVVPVGLEFGINYLFLKDKPLYWDYSTYTLLTSLTAGFRGLGLLCILPIIRKYCKISDPIIGIIGGLSATIYLIMFGLGNNTVTIFMTSVVGCLQLYLMVASRSIISKNVEKSEEGKVFAFLSMLHNILFLISGSIYNLLWPITRTIFKGLLHECSCINMFICIVIMIYLQIKMSKKCDYIFVNDEGNQKNQCANADDSEVVINEPYNKELNAFVQHSTFQAGEEENQLQC